MARKKTKKNAQPSVVDMLNATFMGQDLEDEIPENETPIQTAKRLGKKLPPLNNPRTKAGRKWMKANLKRVEKGRGMTKGGNAKKA